MVPVPFEVRKPEWSYAEDLPRHWHNSGPVATHLGNAAHLFFPVLERFLIRVLRRAVDELDSPEHTEVFKTFFGQEAQHAREHQRFIKVLRRQGYAVDRAQKTAESCARAGETWLSPKMGVAVVAGLEHCATTVGDWTLRYGTMNGACKGPRELLEWHAAEEIEHRSAAYDLFLAYDGSYARRVLGFVIAGLSFFVFFTSCMALMLHRDRCLIRFRTLGDVWSLLFGAYCMVPRTAGQVLSYFHPRFHPSERENDHLAQAAFLALSMKPTASLGTAS